ncbi:MAG TPA: GGDEF domain-containing protein [Caldilineaceae bacterium]|nr:GGDEF domain-containing protein [Caldilineaceae bacterium]
MKHPLGIRVDSPWRVWFFVLLVTLFATFSSLITVAVALRLTGFGSLPITYVIAGVVPLFVMPPVTYVLAQIAYELTCTQEELLRLARTDELTGIFNRRAFFEQGNRMIQHAEFEERPVGLLLIDADNFKQVNDSFGHAAGDHALRHLAQTIAAVAKPEDVVARFGGDEFAVLRHNASKADMAVLAASIQSALACQEFIYQNHRIALAISTGVADSTAVSSFDGLLLATDMALYGDKADHQVALPATPFHANHYLLPMTALAASTSPKQ